MVVDKKDIFGKDQKQECTPVGCVPSAVVAMSTPACTGHCVSQHVLGGGGGKCVSQHALGRGCVYPSMHWAGGCLPGGLPRGRCLPIGVSARGGG